MPLIKRILVSLVGCLLIISCSSANKAGDIFYKNIYASGDNALYKFDGEFNNNFIYIKRRNSPILDEGIYAIVTDKNNMIVQTMDYDTYISKIYNARLTLAKKEEKQQRLDAEKKEKSRKDLDEKKKRDRELAIENERIERERCLGSGAVGVCQISKKNQLVYFCDQNALVALDNMFNQYCYTTDNFSITSYLEVRNNLNRPIRDITFTCQQIANSGTVLSTNSSTIYDVWQSYEIKKVSIKLPKHSQVNYMSCKPTSWK